ncbi:hypothetical protein BC834DRAFT_633878 [Gloeopeniophorella convolvens]|nr:hypothetical protein BC834DRAFT_633878 [Gloeopeniophorella convolvens]
MSEGMLGGALIGSFASFTLFGMTVLQAHRYFISSQGDSRMLKLQVSTVLLLETVHSAFCAYGVYQVAVVHSGDNLALNTIDWSQAVCLSLDTAPLIR